MRLPIFHAQTSANRVTPRGDLHGFELRFPAILSGGMHTVCVHAQNAGAGSGPWMTLGCKEILRVGSLNLYNPGLQPSDSQRVLALEHYSRNLLSLADIAFIQEDIDNEYTRILAENSGSLTTHAS